jgi:hypothetical protein
MSILSAARRRLNGVSAAPAGDRSDGRKLAGAFLETMTTAETRLVPN